MSEPQLHLARGQAGCLLAARTASVVIVVDALRASCTLATLFDRGAACALVVAEVDDARALSATMPDALLVGERGGIRLPGFHLGNSPLEVLSYPRIDGRTVIFTSSNGAQRLTACAGAERILVGTTSNVTHLAEWARAHAEDRGRDIILVAAGKYPDEEFVSPEDEATCAYLAQRIGLPIAPAAREAFQQWERALVLQGLQEIFHGSRHAHHLVEMGYGEDIQYCARPDTSRAVPMRTDAVSFDGRVIGVRIESLAR